MVKQAWVDSNDRYGTGKTESNPRTCVGQTDYSPDKWRSVTERGETKE